MSILLFTAISGLLACGMGVALLGSVKLPLARRLAIDEGRVGGMVSMFPLAMIPVILGMGFLADLIGQQQVLIGGWGGGLCGVSCFDFLDASENQWSECLNLENERWYTLRVRVTPGVLQVFLDETLFTARVEGPPSRFSLRSGSDIDKTGPLGLATYRTKARWRNFTLTPITELGPKDKPMLEE